MPRVNLSFSHRRPRESLSDHVTMGAQMAGIFSLVALTVLLLGLIAKLAGADPGSETSITDLAVRVGFTIVGYFAAGLIGAVAVWALHPLRRSVIGWILTGIAVATIAYGGITLLAILAYTTLEVNIIGFGSPADAWRVLPYLSVGLGLVTGIPGGIYFWWKRPWG